MRQTRTHAPPKPPPGEFDSRRIIEAAMADDTVRSDLLAWARKRIANRPSLMPEDLVQEGCQRAWKKASGYDPERATPTVWIIGYMKYVWLEERRKYATRPKMQSWDDSPAMKDFKIPTEKDYDAEDFRFRVHRHFPKLSKDDQAVVRMKYFEGLEGLEAAKRLGISHDMFRTRLSRALNKLRAFARGDDKEGRS
jgi:RNA polymerase sigma factor (sigma-70 family)